MSMKLKRAHKVGNKKLFSSSGNIQTQSGVLSASQLFDPILLPRSFSTAEIGIDHEKDERRASQMRHLLRQFAQPKSEMRLGTGRDQRRKQVDAIYSYLESAGMQKVPVDIQVSLEDYVNENKRYFAWLPTEPKYLVICEPTPEPNLDGTFSTPGKNAGTAGQPQGFMAAFDSADYDSNDAAPSWGTPMGFSNLL